ncbi:hypothetical protein EP51_46745 (plasmid) [Rhodococcus opacus]|uniref:Uncharacterized protein n=1 Tax=Rhodococcus opacus TaxID=37919 RepID=A0A076F0E7_RHOOP|nr:hypothetical protein EP51_46745 [Rhodococcus opacus]
MGDHPVDHQLATLVGVRVLRQQGEVTVADLLVGAPVHLGGQDFGLPLAFRLGLGGAAQPFLLVLPLDLLLLEPLRLGLLS